MEFYIIIGILKLMDTRFESLLCSDFVPLHFYEEGGYYIYFDESGKDVLSHKLDQGIGYGSIVIFK